MAQAQLEMAEVLETIRAVKEILAGLENRLVVSGEEILDHYKRRKEILQRIYWAGNSMTKDQLLPELQAAGTNSRWIGQQVKKGYLTVIPVPGGATRYAVTQKAVRELKLQSGEEEEALVLAKLAESAFAEDWNSEEDSIYDTL